MNCNELISVIVLSYNSDWDKTRRTLYSILIQKNVTFEIVVSDDGSKNNNYALIEEYFASMSFNNYVLVKNEKNMGIIKNSLSALEHAKGDYVKLISPGDFLYNEFALEKIFSYAKQTSADLCCANAVYYSIEDSEIAFWDDLYLPRNVTPYIQKNKREIRRSLLFNGNYLHGAAFFVKKAALKEALLFASPTLRFAEDVAVSFFLAAKKKNVVFCDFSMFGNKNCPSFIWYEYGSGISSATETKNIFNELDEPKKMLELLKTAGLVSNFEWFYRYGKNSICKKIVKILMNPCQYVHDKFHLKYKTMKRDYDASCLKKILES